MEPFDLTKGSACTHTQSEVGKVNLQNCMEPQRKNQGSILRQMGPSNTRAAYCIVL